MPVDHGRFRGARWALPVALLVAEYLFLSFLIDLAAWTKGSRWIEIYRLAAPVSIGTAAAGWLLARDHRRLGSSGSEPPAPPWWPWPGVVTNLTVFALAAWLSWTTFGPEAVQHPRPWVLPALVGLGALAALSAAATAGPLSWMLSRVGLAVGALPVALALGLVTWGVVSSVEGAWGYLSTATLRTVGAILRATGGEVVVLPAEQAVGLGGFEVEIAPVCSGVDGMGLFLLFEAIWLVLARDRLRFPRAFLLLPVGAGAAFAANAVRIATLVWVGASGHEAIALGGLHSKLGWILSVGLALGSIALAERTSWFQRPHPAGPASREAGGVPAASGVFLGPLLAAMATALVTGIWVVGRFDPWYGARIAAAAAVLVTVRGSLPSLRPSRAWTPVLVGVGVALVWVAAAGASDDALAGAMAGLGVRERWAWVSVRLVGSILVVPVAEELAFRGFLLPWLVSPHFDAVPPRAWTWPAVLLSSLAFGAVHSELVLGTLAGLAFAFARLWRGRLGDAIVAHAVANAGVALAVVAMGRWRLWA